MPGIVKPGCLFNMQYQKYIVSFDLDTTKGDRQDTYKKVDEYLSSFSLHCKPLDNVYLVGGTFLDSLSILNKLRTILSPNDTILICSIDGEYQTFNYKPINDKVSRFFHS